MKDEVLIVGCGEIGSSLIEGWLNKKREFYKNFSRISVLEKNLKRRNLLKKKYKEKIYFIETDKIKERERKFRYVFLSFKPKDLNFKLNSYKNLFDNNTVFLSVLAGKRILDIEKFFLKTEI